MDAAVRAPAGDEPVVPEHVGVVVAVHFDFQSEGERLADGPSLVRVPVAGVLRVRAGVPFVAVGAVAFVALLAVFLAVRAQAVVAHAAPVPAVLAQAVLAVLAVVCAVPAHPRTAFVACARAVVAYSVAAPAFDGFCPRAVLAQPSVAVAAPYGALPRLAFAVPAPTVVPLAGMVVSGHLSRSYVVLSSGRCAAGPDGRGAAQAAWPVGPVPGPPSAAAPAGRHADACDAPDVRSCCVPAGRAGARLRWRDPFSTCSRRTAGRGGGSASPSGRAPFSAAIRIRLDRDSQNRYHCFP